MRQLIVVLASLVPAAAYAQADCTPARMMFVVDHSSSMNGVVDATMQTKWTIARNALGTLAASYEKKIDLGLNVFPNPSQCAPGKTVVATGPANASRIVAALPGAPPSAGNYTPMAQSIDAAVTDLLGGAAMADPARTTAIALVTDGWQWCSPYDPKTRTWPIDAVQRAAAKGVKVYVVGFGSEVDVATMSQMAVAAGTALAGCDPNATDVAAPNKCYYQADSAAELQGALDAISLKVSAEVCDGVDNDCDGLVDEDLVRACANGCGGGEERCASGSWVGCTAPAPVAETCDSKDNDCDGTIDEGCFCQPNTVRECGSILGACFMGGRGKQTCGQDGKWGACVGATAPSPEVCNGIDDDCNGIIDEGSTAALCPEGGLCGADGKCHDAGTPASGCGCHIGAGSTPPAAPLLVLLGLGLLIVSRRRRRS